MLKLFLMNILEQMALSKHTVASYCCYKFTAVHRWLSVAVYTVFLFLVITVLLNLLIAQMSDTYTNVQSDAQRSLFINVAWIVSKIEHSSLFSSALLVRFSYNYLYIQYHIHLFVDHTMQNYRKRHYIDAQLVNKPYSK